MADEVDNAQEKTEIGLAEAIRLARLPVLSARSTGRCLYCDDPLGDGIRWCGILCRDSYQKRTGLK